MNENKGLTLCLYDTRVDLWDHVYGLLDLTYIVAQSIVAHAQLVLILC